MEAVAYSSGAAGEWDAFVRRSINGTLLHTRRYLGYHQDRFADRSVIVRDDRGRILSVVAAALDPGDPRVVVSHPGITYGGLVHEGLDAAVVMDCLAAAVDHWPASGAVLLRYKAIPSFYNRTPAESDAYALWRMGATCSRVDVSTTVPLTPRPTLRGRRRRTVQAAVRAGLDVRSGRQEVPVAWEVIAETLARRHGTSPTHSRDELEELADLLPDEIRADVAYIGSNPAAAVISYLTDTCWHTQYLATSEAGAEANALDLVVDRLMALAAESHKWFDFGISNEDQGRVLNAGLQHYKASFGGGATLHEFYSLDLTRAQASVD